MKTYYGDGKTFNYTNSSGSTITSGTIVDMGGSFYGVAVTDIEDGKLGALLTCGEFSLPVPDGTTLSAGDEYKVVLATQVFNASTGVNVGRVNEQVGQTAHVLLNGLPGGVR